MPSTSSWSWTSFHTHDFSSLYETFEPQEARRIRQKLEIHYTPKHGSWLNMAEIELAVLNGQCLDRRIGQEAELRQEVAAWEARCESIGDLRLRMRVSSSNVSILSLSKKTRKEQLLFSLLNISVGVSYEMLP